MKKVGRPKKEETIVISFRVKKRIKKELVTKIKQLIYEYV